MLVSRRAFSLGAMALSAACSASPMKPRAPLKLLVLGGTNFVGPATVEAAVKRGHQVTLFNRCKSNPGLFPTHELIRGDRDEKSQNLAGLSKTFCICPEGMRYLNL